MNMNEYDLVAEFDERYKDGFYAWDAFFTEAERDMRFWLGDQWTQVEKRQLYEEGRNAFVFNMLRPVIFSIIGHQEKNRLSSNVVPLEDSDQKTADQLDFIMQQVMSNQEGYKLISQCFAGALKTGWNLASVYLDYRDDPLDGDICFSREPWNGFIVDPYFTRLDFSDCNYILRRRYISVQQAISMLPKQKKDLDLLHKIGWERDDKFTWLPYQRKQSLDPLMAYDEYWRQGWDRQAVLVDRENGLWKDWDGNEGDFARLKILQPQFEMIYRQKRFIERIVYVNNEVMDVDRNIYGLDEYPFVPFVCLFEPESDEWALKLQSLVRPLIDPQREANRRRSQAIDIIESKINQGNIVEEGTIINEKSLYKAGQGQVIYRRKGTRPDCIMPIPPADIPGGQFQFMQQMDQDIKEIAGLNDAAMGQVEHANESGVMQLLRQGAALTNCQDFFDNLNYSQRCLSKKVLKLIQTFSPAKVERMIGEKPTQEFYDQKFSKYDCVIREGMLTDTQKQQFFRQMLDLQQLGEPMPPGFLARIAPIQGKSEYYEEMEKFREEQAKEAQRQQQIQDQLIQGQTELTKAQAINNIASGKERFTRGVANMGLEDERTSEAVQNRSQAVLDQVRSAKEIEQIGLQNIEKALLLTQLLDDSKRQEELINKVDNIKISNTGDSQ